MVKRASVLLVMGLLSTCGLAKDKNKNLLPAYVLQARTICVIIDPQAGISIENPRANQVAQRDVEAALANWGRFDPVLATQAADLIIVIRKGNGRLVNETLPDPRQNNRAGSITPSDNGISIGGQHTTGLGTEPGSASPETEIGSTEDSFIVYEGKIDHPTDTPAAWHYRGRDGLHPDSVPAVAAFRKAVADAEKAANKP